ncbi:MAG: alpha-amylase family protein [Edaphobacter sp.]
MKGRSLDINRRSFMAFSATAAAAASLPVPLFASTPVGQHVPWHQKIRRAGQINITEHDPAVLNVEEWANYWASLKTDVVFASITGIIAYYPTQVPFHRRSKFLNGRDFTGELVAAAKKRNMRVIARFSPDLNWGDALQAHPEWFKRDKEGNPLPLKEDPRLYQTCMFTTYMTEHMPAIMREVNSRYAIDGLFTNAWPPLGRMPECYCNACKDLPHYDTPAYWDKFTERVLYLWKLWDGIAKEKGPDNLYFGNMGGSVESGPNMMALAKVCDWYNCDNQGRVDDAPIWGCTLQGRVCNAIMKGRTSTNVTAAYATGDPRWRNTSKPPAEATLWMSETVASGMVPWWHFVGAEDGLGADRRWQEVGSKFFNWLALHDQHLRNKATIADIAVVMGQRTQRFYKLPAGGGRTSTAEDRTKHMNGLYYALLEGRFLFDFVHEDDLGAANLKKYKTLILPNIALLSDEQCSQIKSFVQSGGSVMASFETSMYNERNERRADFGLADVFGIHATGTPVTSVASGFMARIERKHPLVDGFNNTDWIPGAQYRMPISPVPNPVLTVVPPTVVYPPELAYPTEPHTDIPAVVLKDNGNSRMIYFAGDVERTNYQSGNTDISKLLQNAIRWVTKSDAPQIQGDGIIESFAWETEAGFALHVLNYTNPNMFRGSLRKFYPIGAQTVAMSIPSGKQISRVELLRAAKDIPFKQSNGKVEFVIPSVDDYEIAAMYAK